MSDLILIDIQDGIARMTLNEPDKLNAMSPEMGQAIQATVPELNGNKDVRVVVIQGAGRAFSAGGNLDNLENDAIAGNTGERTGEGIGGGRSFYSLFLSIRNLEMPTIAAINGHAIGAGFCFSLGADMRVVHEKAKMGMTFVKLGIHPGMAATWNLPRIAGDAVAAELLYTGRLIGADEAISMGIASRKGTVEDFDSVVDDLARQVAGSAPLAVRRVKHTLRGTHERSIEDAIGVEADEQGWTFTTKDALEGIRAIKEKRAPEFQSE